MPSPTPTISCTACNDTGVIPGDGVDPYVVHWNCQRCNKDSKDMIKTIIYEDEAGEINEVDEHDAKAPVTIELENEMSVVVQNLGVEINRPGGELARFISFDAILEE